MIQPGDIVRLKSGGPDMVVGTIDDKGDARCKWETPGHIFRQEWFGTAMLDVVHSPRAHVYLKWQKYEPRTIEQAEAYLIEECGEVLAAAGKTLRWGQASVNPELPSDQQEMNIDWVLRELHDLERAIICVRAFAGAWKLDHQDEMDGK